MTEMIRDGARSDGQSLCLVHWSMAHWTMAKAGIRTRARERGLTDGNCTNAI